MSINVLADSVVVTTSNEVVDTTVAPSDTVPEQTVETTDINTELYNQLLVVNEHLGKLYILLFLLFAMFVFNFFYKLITHNITNMF